MSVDDEMMKRGAAAGSLDAALLAPGAAPSIEVEWSDLAAAAVEPNPFYGPALLIPALREFGDKRVRLAVVRSGGALIALAPLIRVRGYSRLPIDYMASWMHPHCFLATPLIRAGCECAALAALFDLAAAGGWFLRLRRLDAKGPVFAAAGAAAAATGRIAAPSALFRRALFTAGRDADRYLQSALSAKKRKELRRQRARLQECGDLEFEQLTAAGDLDRWIADFLALEAAGWKGRAGTALAAIAAEKAFFADAARRAFAAGTLQIFRLASAGRPIAMIVNFIERGAAYSFKIAYDESYARYSPGVLLEIDMMRALENIPGFAFIDSCAAEDHPMINSLWRERRAIGALNVSRRSLASKWLVRAIAGLERRAERADAV
jgi:CelD/BcsL family acetyltransferase involved in cellulose biosynthesis